MHAMKIVVNSTHYSFTFVQSWLIRSNVAGQYNAVISEGAECEKEREAWNITQRESQSASKFNTEQIYIDVSMNISGGKVWISHNLIILVKVQCSYSN